MEIRNLLTFVEVAERSNFTRAAEALGYTQSTVSHQIKQLESELGCLLFERIRHKITLTERGRELLEYARAVCTLTDEFSERMHSPEEVRGALRILTPDSLCEEMIRRNYLAFHERYPAIALSFVSAGTEDMFTLLDENEADLMLTLDAHAYRHDYVIAKEERVPMHFVTGARSPYAGRRLGSLAEVAALPLLLTERGLGYRRVLDEALARQSLAAEPILELSRTDVICDILSRGVGVSFLPDFVTRERVLRGELVYLDAPLPSTEVWKQLIHHKNKWQGAAMRALIGFIAEKEFSS